MLILWRSQDKGLLAQLANGEGKSLVIAMFFIVKAKEGYNVDIITSSSLLAELDSIYFEPLYNFSNQEVKDNHDRNYKMEEAKNCYESNVKKIYGDINNLQFKVLQHEYSRLGIDAQ